MNTINELLKEENIVTMPNFWIVYIQPGGEVRPKQQDLCCTNKCFGMGWGLANETSGTDACKAITNYKDMKAGDYVITRLHNAHYYVGKLVGNLINDLKLVFGSEIELQLGWIVEKWIDLGTDVDLPGFIVGRFSQRFHPTVQKINEVNLCIFMKQFYDNEALELDFKLIVNKHNFIHALDANALEDIVYLYMLEKNKGYRLLPSSCKVNRMKYEFVLFDASGNKITCQVKNRHAIDIDKYKENDGFQKIYIFSGLWDENTINDMQSNSPKHIIIIKPKELFEIIDTLDPTLKEFLFPSAFYCFEEVNNEESLFEGEWTEVTRKTKRNKCYKKNNCNCYTLYINETETLYYYPNWNKVLRF